MRTFVPEGLSESSPVRSAGFSVFKELSVPDGTIDECWQSLSCVQDQKPQHFYRPSRDGPVFCFISQHFVLGYFRQVPAGLIFSNHQRTCASPIASPLSWRAWAAADTPTASSPLLLALSRYQNDKRPGADFWVQFWKGRYRFSVR